jgi:beta-N-acetylhexosaminidase
LSAPSPSPEPASPTPAAPSLESKIGQMLLVGFRGLQIDATTPFGAAIAAGRVGNTVLFDVDLAGAPIRNVESTSQVAALDASLQALAPTLMLISVDEEGGNVARLGPDHGFPATVSAESLGDQNDLDRTRSAASAIATALVAAGINLNLAPVVDLNVNPANPIIGSLGRSFSADPEVVTRNALAFIEAQHAAGVLCTLKHFPGHGSSTADSHLGFVDVTDTWSETELVPYRRIVAAGMADVVMTAHVFNRNLDPDYPATLSRRVITSLLRKQIGYDGVVITDDMQMGAIADNYGFTEALELAVNAGADIIAIANNGPAYDPDVHAKAFDAIHAAVMAGRIDEAGIDSAYERIRSLKKRLRS